MARARTIAGINILSGASPAMAVISGFFVIQPIFLSMNIKAFVENPEKQGHINQGADQQSGDKSPLAGVYSAQEQIPFAEKSACRRHADNR